MRGRFTIGFADDGKTFMIADESELGRGGNTVALDCCITLMAPDSTTFDALIFVEIEGGGVATHGKAAGFRHAGEEDARPSLAPRQT